MVNVFPMVVSNILMRTLSWQSSQVSVFLMVSTNYAHTKNLKLNLETYLRTNLGINVIENGNKNCTVVYPRKCNQESE